MSQRKRTNIKLSKKDTHTKRSKEASHSINWGTSEQPSSSSDFVIFVTKSSNLAKMYNFSSLVFFFLEPYSYIFVLSAFVPIFFSMNILPCIVCVLRKKESVSTHLSSNRALASSPFVRVVHGFGILLWSSCSILLKRFDSFCLLYRKAGKACFSWVALIVCQLILALQKTWETIMAHDASCCIHSFWAFLGCLLTGNRWK